MRMQSDTTNDLPVTEPDPTPMKTPVMVHGGARPKTPRLPWHPHYKTPSFPHTALNPKKNTFLYTIGRKGGGDR